MREKGDSLIESIARFDIRENQDIGLAVDGRYNAFDVAARLFTGSLYIQRAVDDDISELACLGKFHNIDIIQRMRELGAHLFRTMDKCDTRLFDTEMAAGMDGIPNHLYALLQGGPGNDCGIRKEQQFIIGGNLHDSQMCQNLSFDRLYEVSDKSLPNQIYSQNLIKVMQEKIDFFKSNSGINSIDYNASSGQLTIINEKQKIIYQRDDPGFDVFKVLEVSEKDIQNIVDLLEQTSIKNKEISLQIKARFRNKRQMYNLKLHTLWTPLKKDGYIGIIGYFDIVK